MFGTQARYFRVDRRDLVYLKSVLEAYEGLAVLSTVEREGAVVRIAYPHFSAADVDALLKALAGEIAIVEVPRPTGYSGALPEVRHKKGVRFAG